MSVLIEGISVVVRNETLEEKFPGGAVAYCLDCPNKTFSTDGRLTRVGFMVPNDVGFFVRCLQKRGLLWVDSEKRFRDVAVVDQLSGPTSTCDWLVYERQFDGPAYAWQTGTELGELAVPRDWCYEESLSKDFVYTPKKGADRWRAAEGHRDGCDLYIHPRTGRKSACARPFGPDVVGLPD
jgi:hypothetical protein